MDLIQRLGIQGLEQVTMVFPMQRAGLFVKQCLSDYVLRSDGDIPMVLPRFTTIDALADSLCDLQSDDEIASVCALYQIYRKHTQHTLPLDAFYGWGVQLLSDFSSADMALLDVDRLMHYTSDAAQLEHLLLDEATRQRLEHLLHDTGDAHSVRDYFTSLWQALPAIYEDFHALHLHAGVGTRGERTRWVIEHFSDQSVQQRILGRTFVFVGFNYLLAAERRLMQLLRDDAAALFYWDYNPDFHLDPEVYRFLLDHIAEFGNALPAAAATVSVPHTTAIACQSASAQAQYVRDWLLQHHHEGDQTAVVIADESLLQAVVYALPDAQQLPARINITKGYPLRATHLFADTMALFEQHQSSDIASVLPEVISHLEQHYRALQQPEHDSWQAVLLSESYYQIQLVLRQLWVLYQQNDFLRQCLGEYRVLRNLVRRKLEMVTIPFHGEPLTDIQIIGVLETRLLDFDHVLILNVEEDIVPAKAADRSFLPFDLRREYSMATREEEARIYAYNFFRLMRRAHDVTLCFSDSFTELGKRTMSRFLMQIFCAPDWPVQRLRLGESAGVETFALAHTCFQPTDVFPNHLSPSSLSDYIECPRQFYLKHICGISESAVDQVMLPPNILGSLVHSVLCAVYRSVGSVLTAEALRSCLQSKQRLSMELDAAYAALNDARWVRADHEAENHVILTMVQNVLRQDIELCPVSLLGLEQPVHADIPTSMGTVRLVGIADRIDQLGHGDDAVVRIVDYKTGSYKAEKMCFAAWEELFDPVSGPNHRYALQTLIYCAMVTAEQLPYASLPLSPELIYPRAIHASRNIFHQGQPVLRYQALAADFLPHLYSLVDTIRRQSVPGAEFLPCDEKVCAQSYCPFRLLCGR